MHAHLGEPGCRFHYFRMRACEDDVDVKEAAVLFRHRIHERAANSPPLGTVMPPDLKRWGKFLDLILPLTHACVALKQIWGVRTEGPFTCPKRLLDVIIIVALIFSLPFSSRLVPSLNPATLFNHAVYLGFWTLSDKYFILL